MSTCSRKFQLAPQKKGTISFKAVYLWKKICEMYFLAKTLNLHSTCILYRESSCSARLLWQGDVISNFFRMHYAKLIFDSNAFSIANILETAPARKPKFFTKVVGAKRFSNKS